MDFQLVLPFSDSIKRFIVTVINRKKYTLPHGNVRDEIEKTTMDYIELGVLMIKKTARD